MAAAQHRQIDTLIAPPTEQPSLLRGTALRVCVCLCGRIQGGTFCLSQPIGGRALIFVNPLPTLPTCALLCLAHHPWHGKCHVPPLCYPPSAFRRSLFQRRCSAACKLRQHADAIPALCHVVTPDAVLRYALPHHEHMSCDARQLAVIPKGAR